MGKYVITQRSLDGFSDDINHDDLKVTQARIKNLILGKMYRNNNSLTKIIHNTPIECICKCSK
ncbi:hypothetical protein UT300012_24660 [Paraclostridium bifermentans]